MPDLLRKLPAANATLYNGGAEGWPIQMGYDVFDIPAKRMIGQEDDFGSNYRDWLYDHSTILNTDGTYSPTISVIKELNTICPKVRAVQYDTAHTDFITHGGEFETTTPLDEPRKTRMVQRSAKKNEVSSAESIYTLTANPNVCITVERLSARYDNDHTNYPAKVQVVLGDYVQVRFADGEDAGIWRKIGGRWTLEKHLELSDRGKEYQVWVVVRRGCICFSFDKGTKWEILRDKTGALSIPAGQVVVEGVSCQYSIGVHQLFAEVNTWYASYDLPTIEDRWGAPYVDLTFTLALNGTRVQVTFLASSPASVKYKMSFTSTYAPVANLPFEMLHVPEVYAVLIYWPTILAPAVLVPTDLAGLGYVEEIDVTEDTDISQRSGSIKLLWDPFLDFVGNYGYRVLDVDLGYMMEDDSFDLVNRAAFYVIRPETQGSNDFDASILFDLVDFWHRATTTLVDEGWRPLDGMTCVAARNYILSKMCLPPSRANWWDTGKVLGNGLPDDPRWWPSAGTTCDELFRAIDAYEQTESFVANDGTWTSRPFLYVDNFTSFTFDSRPTHPDYRIESLHNPLEHREAKTAWICSGRDLQGSSFWASAIDYRMERMPAFDGFVGWRQWDRVDKDLRGEKLKITTLADAIYVVNFKRALNQAVPMKPEMQVPGHQYMFRGQLVQLANSGPQGILDTDRFRLESLHFQWRGVKTQTKTTARMRKIYSLSGP